MAAATKFAAVTGSNRGIGLALVENLAAAGWTVAAACRKASDALTAAAAANDAIKVVEGADIGTEEGVTALFDGVSAVLGDSNKLSLLFNNAGMMNFDDFEHLGADAFAAMRKQYSINAVQPVHVTVKLLPLIADGAKVAFTTSMAGSIPLTASFPGLYGYKASKTALNVGAALLSNDLKDRGILTISIHPGVVDTDMAKPFPMEKISPADSAAKMLDVVDKLTAEGSGKFVTYDGGVELDPPVDTPFDNAVPDPLPEVEAGEGRYALVTGASSGIGLGIVEALAGANWNVLATVRKNSEELAAVAAAKSNVTVIEGVDVAKEEGVDAMFAGASAALGDNKLDLLFNNAGLMTPQDMAAMGTKEGVEAADYQFNVNTVGALAGTVKLMPLIKESTGRIAFTTSGLGSLPFLQMGAFPSLFGYSMSKNALNMVAATLARDLKSKGIFVAALHPGVVTSKLSTGFEMDKLTPEQSAKAMLKVVADLTEETTGGFFHYKGTPYEVPKE